MDAGESDAATRAWSAAVRQPAVRPISLISDCEATTGLFGCFIKVVCRVITGAMVMHTAFCGIKVKTNGHFLS